MDMLVIKEYAALGYNWRLLRHRMRAWYYLERDGLIVAEGSDRRALLAQGWYL